MPANAIEIEKLSYSYAGNWGWKKRVAVQKFSLQVIEGESFGFLGHNGAGKTTTIKCILDLVRPTTGSVAIFGVDSKNPNARASLGYIPEHPYFYDNLSVRESLCMYAQLSGLKGVKLNTSLDETISRVGLMEKQHSPLRSLSKGLTQRLALAQAIIAAPRLLILDEPFSGLDPLGRKEFRDIFFGLKSKGTTLFMSSHILSDVEYLCDKVSVMVRGELKGIFTVREIPRLSGARYELVVRDALKCEAEICKLSEKVMRNDNFLQLTFNDRSKAEAALRCALDGSAGIESFELVQGGLEELFVKIVKGESVGGGER